MPDASPAVFAVNDRKPRQGGRGQNPGLHQRFAACKSTTALGVSWGQWSGTVPGARVSYEYDAYGNSFTVSGSTPNEMMYRGEQYDSDLGLYYLRARYYNPLTGRFMSMDPNDPQLMDANRNPIDPRELHKYLYAGGDPVNRVDPSGRGFIEDAQLQNLESWMFRAYIDTLEGAQRKLYAQASCVAIAALWAVENPGATISEILGYIADCEGE
jgi:RHS repeat-associated protein